MASDFHRRSCILAWLAVLATPLAAKPLPDSRNASVARATARIERPVVLRSGQAEKTGQNIQQSVRERPCARDDMPKGEPCRLIVTDLE